MLPSAWRHWIFERAANWARRRQGLDSFPLTLQRRRLYVLPTRAGVVFGLLLLFMLIAGLNYANSLALFLTFLLAGFAIVAMHRCHRNLLGLSVIAAIGRPAFAGESARFRITLGDDTLLARGAVEVAVLNGDAGRADVAAGGRAAIELDVPAPRRGLVRIDRMELATSFPFGLFRAWTWIHSPVDAVVYPRPRGTRAPPEAPERRAGQRAHAGIGDDEWLGLRGFRDGDSPRRVAWKAFARGAPLMVKEYGAAADDLRMFDFDSLRGLDAESRLEQLARWIVDAEARGDRYGLTVNAVVIEAGRGLAHRHRCLRALALHGIEE
ncbi:MAG: DUF58 domain-containing protein [Steroidobacteraceae bacterium]